VTQDILRESDSIFKKRKTKLEKKSDLKSWRTTEEKIKHKKDGKRRPKKQRPLPRWDVTAESFKKTTGEEFFLVKLKGRRTLGKQYL